MTALHKFVLGLGSQCYFVTSKEMPELLRIDRKAQLLVRCGMARFICTAEELKRKMEEVTENGDYVRDVSFPCAVIDAARVDRERVERAERERNRYVPEFREEELGGVLGADGQVYSDADPGL